MVDKTFESKRFTPMYFPSIPKSERHTFSVETETKHCD